MVYHPSIIRRTAFEDVALAAGSALDIATRQQTGATGTGTWHNVDGTKTIQGPGAGPEGVVHWVGDTTPPGRPTGVTVGSGAGMILVAWDGGLEGGVPPDFDHLSLIVDGLEAGRALAKGVYPLGPYEPGSVHEVKVVAWDDAHAQDGSPAPNGSSAWGPERVTVSGADIDPESLGILVTKAATDPEGAGKHRGDLWLRYGEGERPAVAAEWWWDGDAWVPIPVAVYLDQLAARDVQVDAAVIGLICAGIIRSGQFSTPDGLVGFDSSGFWSKGVDGKTLFKASGNGVQAVGGLQTAGGGDRIQLSQTLIQGTTTGGLQGIGDDPTHPYWLIWGDHDEDGLVSRLMMGTSTQQPEISIVRGQQGRNNVGLTADRVDIVGRQIVGIEGDVALDGRSIYAPDRRVYQWVSSWTGRPGYPGGTWYTENTASLTVRSPGQGRWYVLDMGERITGPGEGFLLAVIRKNGENIATHVVSSSATPGGQTDNYSASRRFWLPDGVYQITVYFKYFGDCQVSGGDVYLCYTDPQVSGWFARYVFLTEC